MGEMYTKESRKWKLVRKYEILREERKRMGWMREVKKERMEWMELEGRKNF